MGADSADALQRLMNLFGAAALATDRFADAAEKIDKPPAPTGEVKTGGSRMIPIDGGKFHVWTKKIGNLSRSIVDLPAERRFGQS